MPADTNQHGDIFGGWLLGQMDIAGEFSRLALQREEQQPLLLTAMTFRNPVSVGDVCVPKTLSELMT